MSKVVAGKSQKSDAKPHSGEARTVGNRRLAGRSANVLDLQKSAGNSSVSAAIQAGDSLQPGNGNGTEPVHKALSKQNGHPLPADIQQEMGERFHHDFSQVRVYTSPESEHSAREIRASAYTVGNNVVFGAGRYQPTHPRGRRLIAHELTHVVQQANASPADSLTIQPSSSVQEAQARGAGAGISSGQTVAGLTPVGTQAVQRQPEEESAAEGGTTSTQSEEANLGTADRIRLGLIRRAAPLIARAMRAAMPVPIPESIMSALVAAVMSFFIRGYERLVERGDAVRFLSRVRELMDFDTAVSFVGSYLWGLLKGLVSPVTGIVQMIGMAVEFQAAAWQWIARQAVQAPQLLAEAELLTRDFRTLGPVAGTILTSLRQRERLVEFATGIMSSVSSEGGGFQQRMVTAGEQKGREAADSLVDSLLRTPLPRLAETAGEIIGTVVIEVVLLLFTGGVGNLITKISTAVRSLRFVVEGSRAARALAGLARVGTVIAEIEHGIGLLLNKTVLRPLQPLFEALEPLLGRLRNFITRLAGLETRAATSAASTGTRAAGELVEGGARVAERGATTAPRAAAPPAAAPRPPAQPAAAPRPAARPARAPSTPEAVTPPPRPATPELPPGTQAAPPAGGRPQLQGIEGGGMGDRVPRGQLRDVNSPTPSRTPPPTEPAAQPVPRPVEQPLQATGTEGAVAPAPTRPQLTSIEGGRAPQGAARQPTTTASSGGGRPPQTPQPTPAPQRTGQAGGGVTRRRTRVGGSQRQPPSSPPEGGGPPGRPQRLGGASAEGTDPNFRYETYPERPPPEVTTRNGPPRQSPQGSGTAEPRTSSTEANPRREPYADEDIEGSLINESGETMGRGGTSEEALVDAPSNPRRPSNPRNPLDLPEYREAVESSQRAMQNLPEARGQKTVAGTERGTRTESGYGEKPNYESGREASERAVLEGQQAGRETQPHFRDPKTPGDEGLYYGSHAEQQAAIHEPDAPVGVSERMCSECQGWFRDRAINRQTPQFVTDPTESHIFMPDGRHITVPHPQGTVGPRRGPHRGG